MGSVKINSIWRKKLFEYNLISLEPISSCVSWRFNVVGKYSNYVKDEITSNYKDSIITTDDATPYYQLIKDQIQNSNSDLVLFWLEDHLFLCSNKNLFLYLLHKFNESNAEILTISHLLTSWKRKPILPVVTNKYLYKEYMVDVNSQKKLLAKYPNAYLTGIPAIYKRDIAMDMLEYNKCYLSDSKHPGEYELYGDKSLDFLRERPFIEMIPTFHVFREVFWRRKHDRAISLFGALKILKLRRNGDI